MKVPIVPISPFQLVRHGLLNEDARITSEERTNSKMTNAKLKNSSYAIRRKNTGMSRTSHPSKGSRAAAGVVDNRCPESLATKSRSVVSCRAIR